MEVLVAIAVTAIVAGIAAQAFDGAQRAHEATRANLDRLQRLDRAWLALEVDLRNAVSRVYRGDYGDLVLPLKVEDDDEDWLSVLRGGRPNPLHFYRSELTYVSYSLDENTLVRRSWIDPANQDEKLAHQQKLLEGVEEIQIRVLPPGARSVKDGPWLDEWPPKQAPAALPQALEITMEMETEGEIVRLFSLVPGL